MGHKPETAAMTTIGNPASLLEQAGTAMAGGNIQEYALLAHQAADSAVHNPAQRLGYSISDESDIHRFILPSDGVPPQPRRSRPRDTFQTAAISTPADDDTSTTRPRTTAFDSPN